MEKIEMLSGFTHSRKAFSDAEACQYALANHEKPMNLLQLLEEQRPAIVAEAKVALERAQLMHYQHIGDGACMLRLSRLYAMIMLSLRMRSLVPVMDHVAHIAEERFEEGCAMWEVLTVINVLEETIGQHVTAGLTPATSAEALGMVSTLFGACKEALTATYVALAGKQYTSVGLNALA